MYTKRARLISSPSSLPDCGFFLILFLGVIFAFVIAEVISTDNTAYAVCLFRSRAACLRLKLHSSYARPAPKPTPAKAGHALRLNSRTEKTTPNPRPRVDLTRRFERQWSHLSVLSAQVTLEVFVRHPMVRKAASRGCLYLLVEERFAHGPGNGAGLRTGDSGVGHCVRFCGGVVSARVTFDDRDSSFSNSPFVL